MKKTLIPTEKPLEVHHDVVFQNMSPLTVQRYGWILDNFLQWCVEHGVNPVSTKVREITNYLQDRPQWGISRKTVALAALGHWFDYQGLPENPAKAASLRKTGRAGRAFAPKRLPAALDDTESAAFLRATTPESGDSFPVRRKHLIQRLLFWTGLRVSEAVHLQVGDIRLDDEHPVLRVIGKGDKERQVPIADRLAMELLDYLEMREAFLDGQMSIKTVFCDRYGNPYTPAGVWSMVGDTFKSIGVEKRHKGPHVLRHTFATRQLQSGHPPAIVKAWMGHSDLRVLFSVYEHVMSSPKGVKPVE
ncbi:tyrosine-type recombinase/integrase [Acidithiobacillus albertensis]|uniref:tyrosine-type recombinase/integrase n=1 Tax=Acidithiobacillus albertensis TaxID=119978 RepID=UPI001C06F79C|nr:tyrosine-type recombinase/integrase [Acidithiobacillus albertensis]MBU2741844.1 tyrosine-type recombinase/integrase [Acidithiobacillus albertensis]